jgi:hypothetical protein
MAYPALDSGPASRRSHTAYPITRPYTADVFTLDQIAEIHDRLGARDTLGTYLLALNGIGVTTYGSYVTDGPGVHDERPHR